MSGEDLGGAQEHAGLHEVRAVGVPQTVDVTVELGAACGEIPLDLPDHSLENLFRTNIQGSFNRGRCEQQRASVGTQAQAVMLQPAGLPKVGTCF